MSGRALLDTGDAPRPEPARTTDWVCEVAWYGAVWRLGLALGADGKVCRLTLDPHPAQAAEIDPAWLAAARGIFATVSATLPRPHDELRAFIAEWVGTPIAAALDELIAVEAEIAAEDAALRGDLVASPEPAGAPA